MGTKLVSVFAAKRLPVVAAVSPHPVTKDIVGALSTNGKSDRDVAPVPATMPSPSPDDWVHATANTRSFNHLSGRCLSAA